jgi:hypothetical protein
MEKTIISLPQASYRNQKYTTLILSWFSNLELAIKKFYNLPCLRDHKTPFSEGALPLPHWERKLHREAKKNLSRRALLGFPSEFVSIRSHPFGSITFPHS